VLDICIVLRVWRTIVMLVKLWSWVNMLRCMRRVDWRGWLGCCETSGLFDSELKTLRIECESFYTV
jgi:hypothetical protein